MSVNQSVDHSIDRSINQSINQICNIMSCITHGTGGCSGWDHLIYIHMNFIYGAHGTIKCIWIIHIYLQKLEGNIGRTICGISRWFSYVFKYFLKMRGLLRSWELVLWDFFKIRKLYIKGKVGMNTWENALLLCGNCPSAPLQSDYRWTGHLFNEMWRWAWIFNWMVWERILWSGLICYPSSAWRDKKTTKTCHVGSSSVFNPYKVPLEKQIGCVTAEWNLFLCWGFRWLHINPTSDIIVLYVWYHNLWWRCCCFVLDTETFYQLLRLHQITYHLHYDFKFLV